MIALLALCCAAALLGLAIIGVLLATAAIEHDYVTWGLFVDLLLAAATGAGAVVAGRAFIQSGWSAIRPLPAVYPEPATGAAVPTTQLPSWANR